MLGVLPMTTKSRLIIGYLPATNDGLSFRGTEEAMFNYAYFAETLLGHKSVICLRNGAYNDPQVLDKFRKVFDTFVWFDSREDLERQLLNLQADALYSIRSGPDSNFILDKIPMLLHCVYSMDSMDGLADNPNLITAAVSKTVADKYGKTEFVPHMINIPDTQDSLRDELQIPPDAIVFGRHGGNDTWDLPIAKEAVIKVLLQDNNIYFLFAVRPYILQGLDHPRAIFLDRFTDLTLKRRFINTCDAMIHAQSMGESFGLSCGEMSTANKPVITWNGGQLREHLRILQDKCIRYETAEELYKILVTFNPATIQQANWNAYQDYTPEKVMEQFDRVFLDRLRQVTSSRPE
jgi:hypothetical protein